MNKNFLICLFAVVSGVTLSCSEPSRPAVLDTPAASEAGTASADVTAAQQAIQTPTQRPTEPAGEPSTPGLKGLWPPEMARIADPPGGHVSAIAFAPSDPRIVYLASNVNAMGVWRSDDAGITWDRVFYDGNFGATHSSTLAVHPEDSDVVLVGDLHGRITRTSDGGTRWIEVYAGEPPVYALAFSQSDPSVAYAGDERGNLLKSTDAGSRWTVLPRVVPEHLENGAIGSLAVTPDDPDTLYAGTRDFVYRSDDGGRTWSRTSPLANGPTEVVEVEISPLQPEVMMAATPDGVYRSGDGGKSWELTLDRHAHSVQVSESEPTRAYAGTANGVYRSNDGGIAWTAHSTGIQYDDIGPLAVHPADPDLVLTGSNIWQWTYHWDPFPASTRGEGLHRTVDGGTSWNRVTGGFVDVDVVALAVDPADPDVVYVGMACSRGIFRTADGGDSWVFISGGPESGAWDIAHYTMRLATDSQSTLYMTGRFGITRSTDRGDRWISTSVRRHFHGVAASPHDPSLVFAGTSPKQDPTEANEYPGGRVLRSVDGGRSWKDAEDGFPGGAGTSVSDFAFDALDRDVVYVSTSSYEIGLPRTSTAVGIYKSVDGGNSWNAVNNGLATVSPMISVDVNALAASPTTPGLLYAGTGNGAVRSTDGGTGWALTGLARQVFSMVIDPTDDDTAFAGTDSGLFQTTDGGVTWERMDSVPSGRVASLAIDPKGRMLYAAVNNVGIFKGVR